MGQGSAARTRRDRWSDWAVVATVVVALLLGWVVMTLAEGQRRTFTDTDLGLTLAYPPDWLLVSDDRLAFQAVDPTAAEFRTTFQARVAAIDPTAPLTPSLASVLNDASLARAQEGMTYRLLDLAEGKELHGQATMEAAYVYVVGAENLFLEELPVVVRGMDVAVPRGDRVYVFSLLAAKDAFERVVPAFRKFVETAEWE